MITIIGGGPRSLSIALYAAYKGLKVTIIDPHPLSTWDAHHMIPYLEMRSPITFDLVTHLPELYQYSLAKFLGIDLPVHLSQKQVEINTTPVTRNQFQGYLEYIFQAVSPSITLVKQQVVDISSTILTLDNHTTLPYTQLVLCLGYQGKPNTPLNLPKSKLLSIPHLLQSSHTYSHKSFLVVGSGQAAAEAVEYLTNQLSCQVYWLRKRTPRIYQYPVPDYKQWQEKSALSAYYTTLSPADRLTYLAKIKRWQPSITPYINSKLTKNYTIISSPPANYDYAIDASGVAPHISSIPTKLTIPTCPYLPTMPLLSNFKLEGMPWYFSGILATAYDGPRQGSIISAGHTAKTIVESILNASHV